MLIFRMRWRFLIYVLVGFAAGCVMVPLVLEIVAGETKIWNAAPFFGSVLLTVGWIVASEVNVGNSRRQHTISLITQHAFDPKRAENRDTIKKTLPKYDVKLTSDMVDFDSETADLTKAIDLKLNFYEFLAVGSIRGDLDENLIRTALNGQFKSFYRQTENYIEFWRAKDRKIWQELAAMYTRWNNV